MNNPILAKKLLPAMHAAGQAIIDGTATEDSVAKHIEEITAWGYDDKVHSKFEHFISDNIETIGGMAAVNQLPGLGSRSSRMLPDSNLIRYVGTILVDFAVLEAARCSSTGNCMTRNEDFLRALPFKPPPFNIKKRPYTPIADTFYYLLPGSHGRATNDVIYLADSGEYDDIFHHLLLWKHYYKEPFHCGYNPPYRDIRSIADYHQMRKKARAEEDAHRLAFNKKQAEIYEHWASGEIARKISDAYEKCNDDDGWIHLGEMANYLGDNFSPETYGEKRLINIVIGLGYDIKRGKKENPLVRRRQNGELQK